MRREEIVILSSRPLQAPALNLGVASHSLATADYWATYTLLFMRVLVLCPFLRILYLLTFLCLLLAPARLLAQTALAGTVLDLKSVPVPGAHVQLSTITPIAETSTDAQGRFHFDHLPPGTYHLTATSPAFLPVSVAFSLADREQKSLTVQFTQLSPVMLSITVTATSPSSLAPDPSETVVVHDQVLDANPGRPGAPISIPGLPIETASGGIKAPQYFAPGVAGDHGEPIAQFFQVGNFLFPNNLPANAHGNGYSDPNFLIAPTIEGVTVDGGAFNVREGNHSVDLASTYVPRQRLNDFLQVTGDYRDIDLVAGWSPRNPNTNGWLAAEASYGNGFLARLEHRQQYKLNGYRQFKFGRHELTFSGLAYYGFSFVPGLIPIQFPVPDDTIDNRQLDRTNNFLAAVADTWRVTPKSQFNFAAFFRDYHLTLRSNFGDGLIQQSENRTVLGGEVSYLQTVNEHFALLAGIDLRRDAPRNLDLDRADSAGIFEPVTSNNLTLNFLEPFVSADGSLNRYIHYDLTSRRNHPYGQSGPAHATKFFRQNHVSRTAQGYHYAFPQCSGSPAGHRRKLRRSLSHRRPAHWQCSRNCRNTFSCRALPRLSAPLFQRVPPVRGKSNPTSHLEFPGTRQD